LTDKGLIIDYLSGCCVAWETLAWNFEAGQQSSIRGKALLADVLFVKIKGL